MKYLIIYYYINILHLTSILSDNRKKERQFNELCNFEEDIFLLDSIKLFKDILYSLKLNHKTTYANLKKLIFNTETYNSNDKLNLIKEKGNKYNYLRTNECKNIYKIIFTYFYFKYNKLRTAITYNGLLRNNYIFEILLYHNNLFDVKFIKDISSNYDIDDILLLFPLFNFIDDYNLYPINSVSKYYLNIMKRFYLFSQNINASRLFTINYLKSLATILDYETYKFTNIIASVELSIGIDANIIFDNSNNLKIGFYNNLFKVNHKNKTYFLKCNSYNSSYNDLPNQYNYLYEALISTYIFNNINEGIAKIYGTNYAYHNDQRKIKFCLVLEYYESDLYTKLKNKSINKTDIPNYIIQIQDIYEELHDLNIVINDFKETNILVSRNKILFCDFGESYIAEGDMLDYDKNDLLLSGTPGYIDPNKANLNEDTPIDSSILQHFDDYAFKKCLNNLNSYYLNL